MHCFLVLFDLGRECVIGRLKDWVNIHMLRRKKTKGKQTNTTTEFQKSVWLSCKGSLYFILMLSLVKCRERVSATLCAPCSSSYSVLLYLCRLTMFWSFGPDANSNYMTTCSSSRDPCLSAKNGVGTLPVSFPWPCCCCLRSYALTLSSVPFVLCMYTYGISFS